MCNQRDRLIGYVYDECDASERDEVQRHLETCGECRTEIAGLRSVREDLLAWDVPDHESVWRPFAPAPARLWWQQVPAWAMATAASLVLMSGAAGGAVAHGLLPDQTRTGVQPVEQLAQPVAVGLTEADLSAAERRWLDQLNEQVGAVDARVQKVSTRPQAPVAESDHDALTEELLWLRSENKALVDYVASIHANIDQIRKTSDFKIAAQDAKISNLMQALQLQLQVK
jgi:hypothetical protein